MCNSAEGLDDCDSHLPLSERLRRSSVQPLSGITDKSHPRSRFHGSHARTISSLPSTRIVTYQVADKRSSIISTVRSGEEDDPMSVPLAKRPVSTGSTEDNHRPDLPIFLNTRNRTTSSYSLASTELQIRPQVVRPLAIRPSTSRPFHVAQDLLHRNTSQAMRVPLGRSQTSPHSNFRASVRARTSVDLQRSGSEGRRGSADWWGSRSIPLGPDPLSPDLRSSGEETTSPPLRSDSPASPAVRSTGHIGSERSSFDLERSTSDIGWLEWGRKRLSSVASGGV